MVVQSQEVTRQATEPTPIRNLLVSVDLSASGPRAIAAGLNSLDKAGRHWNVAESISLYLSPELAEVPSELLLGRLNNSRFFQQIIDENQAWVGLTLQGELRYFAIGSLAKTLFNGKPSLGELKNASALPKILALVWLACRKISVRKRFALTLSVQCPVGEFASVKRLETELGQALESFETPDGTKNVKLKAFYPYPEGSGVLMLYQKQVSEQKLPSLSRVALVMLGFRDITVLPLIKGEFGQGFSSNLGFIKLLEKLTNYCSGRDPEDLAAAVFESAEDIAPEPLSALILSKSQTIESQLEQLQSGIRICRDWYVKSVIRWIDNHIHPDTELIIYAGGTSDYLKPFLSAHYQKLGKDLLWDAGAKVPDRLCQTLSSRRQLDVYAAFLITRSVVFGKDF